MFAKWGKRRFNYI